MPLQPGSSPDTISSNIKETLNSPTFGSGKSRKKRRAMAVAAALRKGQTLTRTTLHEKTK